MKSFWDCDRLCFEDLPTIRDLIWNADWDILSREVSCNRVSCETDGEAATIYAALEDMMALDMRDPSEKMVFLPIEYYAVSETRESIDRRIDSVLLRRRDFALIEGLSAREQLLFSAYDCRKYLKRQNKRLGNKYPNLYAWSLLSWDKTLSYRAWMQGGYCRKERYQALASVVREMLFFGTTADEARRRQRAVRKRLKRDAKSETRGQIKETPVELLFRNYGLESSTDDYESEYCDRLEDAVMVMNHNASVDLHRRVVDFMSRTRRAEELSRRP